LAVLHSRSIAHLDLKPANLFIGSCDSIKIGDFGLANVVPVNDDMDREGDRAYLAPELLTKNPVGTEADIFSLGLIIMEVAANVALPQNGPIWHRLRQEDFSDCPLSNIKSKKLLGIILAMLRTDPRLRPTALEILDHPILQNLVKDLTQPALLISSVNSSFSGPSE
jgi:serine/threonine protein kinase